MSNYDSFASEQDGLATEITNGKPKEHVDYYKLRRYSLWAGIGYSVIIVSGMTAELAVRGPLIDFDDPSATAESIRSHPLFFRMGLLCDLIMSCADVMVSVVLGFLLIGVGASPVPSMISIAFRLMQQAVIGGNLLHLWGASLLLDQSIHPTMTVETVIDMIATENDTSAGETLAFFFLMLHKYGYLLALILFGISMLVLGGLVVVDKALFPQWLGAVIALAGVGYITDSFLFLFRAGYNGSATGVLMLPALVSEFGLTGYLLLRPPRLVEQQD